MRIQYGYGADPVPVRELYFDSYCSCICKADHIEASKHHRDVDYIPRWKREDNNEAVSSICNYPNCTSKTRLIVPNFVSAEALEVILKVPPPYKLCNKHYQIIYQQSVTPVPCASCGMKPLRGTAFTRHSHCHSQ